MSDLLTGLENYEEFVPRLKKAVSDMPEEASIAIVYSDIKHFKYFNDTYGYRRGNKLLARMSEMFSSGGEGFLGGARVVSDNIVCARFCADGDEKVFLEEIKASISYIEQILRKEFSCERIRMTAGVFFIDAKAKGINVETAISNANLARKQSKLDGNDSVTLFLPEMASKIDSELEIISTIDEAIKNHELKAYYQPKIESGTGRIIGAEALVRWIKPNGTMVYPDQFIPIIEKSRQIINVDYYIYNEVFSFLRSRLDNGESVVPVSMNVSRQHMKDLDIIEYVKDLCDTYKVPPEYLEFELTETMCTERTERVMEFISAFHEMGIKVSMDDFGSGYSSLMLLSQIPIDVIKLDRCFLRSRELGDREKIIITNIVHMTKELKMRSLCEGVETSDQSSFLAGIGCDEQQGYYYSKPVNIADFRQLLVSGCAR
ncbi:MAG: GGDEF domain-containing phosphodiesterase [Lachnospiraceae bacterium]|nr:GGDEF domain-containing phosphodiesterase [Lachnospiraceae bacterium]